MAILKGIEEMIDNKSIDIGVKAEEPAMDAISAIKTICHRFHRVAKALRNRHSSRDTLKINDEYDVQDLFFALLKLFFDDVRKEEVVPSYASGSSRTDFILKKERIVIEIKKTRESMSDKDLGEQLIIDLEKYREHPDCDLIVCFVYDPSEFLDNPEGIAYDLNKKHEGEAMVIIEP